LNKQTKGGRQHARYRRDDDDNFEIINGVRVLKDGHSVRTPMWAMDARQRAIAERAAALDGHCDG
jgi:hypothetical protein